MAGALDLTKEQFNYLFQNCKDHTIRGNASKIQALLGIDQSGANKKIKLAEDPARGHDKLFQRNRKADVTKMLSELGVPLDNYDKLKLNLEEFIAWYTSDNNTGTTLKRLHGFSTITSSMESLIENATNYVYLYRGHYQGGSTKKTIMDALQKRVEDKNKPTLSVSRVITLSLDNAADITDISNDFLLRFSDTDTVQLSLTTSGYLGIGVLITDNNRALICFPDSQGNTIETAIELDDPMIIMSLHWLFARMASLSTLLTSENSLSSIAGLSKSIKPRTNDRSDCSLSQAITFDDEKSDHESSERIAYKPLKNNAAYTAELEKRAAEATSSLWVYRAIKSDGTREKDFVDIFLDKHREHLVEAVDDQLAKASFRRVVYYHQNKRLITELYKTARALIQVEGSFLGTTETLADAISIAIFDHKAVVLGFPSEDAGIVLCGVAIEDPMIVQGVIHCYERLTREVDDILIEGCSDYTADEVGRLRQELARKQQENVY